MSYGRCAMTEALDHQQGVWDREAIQEDLEEKAWAEFWAEVKAAEEKGILSAFSVSIIEAAVEKAGELP
jgi:hypothetical protein